MNTPIKFDEIKEKGYVVYSIQDLFPEYVDVLKKIYERAKLVDFRAMSHTGFKNEEKYSTNDTDFSELEKKKEGLIAPEGYSFTQVWYNDNNFFNGFYGDKTLISELILKVAETIYPKNLYLSTTNDIQHIGLTMYNKGCFIADHKDGTNTQKLCNILIYLNEDYKDGVGGELVVENEIVKPTFGTIVFLDFKHVNAMHSVNVITDASFRRYALISCLIKTESSLI